MQHLDSYLESMLVLEERIQRAIDVIRELKTEKTRLESENTRLREAQATLERRAQGLAEEKETLAREGRDQRQKAEEWNRFEQDREEIRARIDSMLAKFEELEI